MREYFSAEHGTRKDRWMIFHEDTPDDAIEIPGIVLRSKSLAEAVCKALQDAYLDGYKKGREAGLASARGQQEPKP
jgi:hypothetical protein